MLHSSCFFVSAMFSFAFFFSFFSGAAPCWDPPPLGPHSGHYSHVAYCPVFSLLSGGKCDKVAFSSHHRRVFRGRGAPHAAPLAGRGGRVVGGAVVVDGVVGGKREGGARGSLCGTRAIVLHEVTGRSDPKSMRKQQLASPWAPFSAEQQLRGDHLCDN